MKRLSSPVPSASTTGVCRSIPTSAVSSAENKQRLCAPDPAFARELAVNEYLSGPAPARSAPIVIELEADRRSSRRQGLSALDGEAFPVEEVVVERGHAILHVKRPPSEPTALHEDCALAAAGRDHHIGGDAERLVHDVEECVLRNPRHALRQREGRPPRHQVRPAGQRGDRTFKRTVVHRKDEVRDGLG